MKALSEQILEFMIPWDKLPWPLDLASCFERQAPLAIEIGFGDGAFILDQAQRRPERNYVAIELSWGQVDRLLSKLGRSGLKNVRVLNGDASLIVESAIQSGTVDEFFINHPDPWPKERHHNRRLIQKELVSQLSRALVADGLVTIATDHADYASWIAAILESQSELVTDLGVTEVAELPNRLITRYQMKARKVGIENHFFVWRKRSPVAPPSPQESFAEMPNVAFRGPVDMETLLLDFEPIVAQERHQNVDIVLNIQRAFRQVGENQWLVETLIREGRLNQQVALCVLCLEAEHVTVRVSSIGYPRATQGVKRAVWHLARAIQARVPALKVDTSTVGSLDD